MPQLFEMIDPVQHYSWGSRSVLAQMQGRPSPSQQPEAELWIGAHRSAPSQLVLQAGPQPLNELLLEEPERFVRDGAQVVADDGSLPFLLKILAIEAPLSIQVHPSIAQAREGFEREEAAGIAIDAAHRSYKDRSDKPETVVALSRLQILTGMRDRAELGLLAEALDQQWLREALEYPEPVLRTVLSLPEDRAQAALAALEAAVRSLPADDELGSVLTYIARSHPGDRGLLVALCMNHFVLEPGESMFTPAGQVHAYLQGTAVEIMACSDNVLRAGLTPKHVDVPELLRIMSRTAEPVEVFEPRPESDGVVHYPLWDPAVTLTAARVAPGAPVRRELAGTCMVLVTEGEVTVAPGGLRAAAGESLICLDGPTTVTVEGSGQVFLVAAAPAREG